MGIAKCILHALRTTIDVEGLVKGVTSATIGNVLPVVLINITVQIHILVVTELVSVVVVITNQLSQLVVPLGILVSIQYVVLLGNLLPAVVSIIAHLGLTFLTALGGYQDNTVSTTATVDSGRRGVFQYGDVLNVVSGDVADALYGESVNDVQGIVRLGDRTTTTDANLYLCVG